MWHWGYGSWWMGLVMFLFWAAVIAAIVWAIRTAGQNQRVDGPTDQAPRRRRPVDVLAERYARGEIDDEEFTRRRRMLEEDDL